jgi:hypothetical protein
MAVTYDIADAVPKKLERAMRSLLKDRLESAGAQDIVVHPDSDHDGDAVVAVEVKHHLVDHPIDLKEVMDADKAVRNLAWEEGERRFIHIRHVFDEKQRVSRAR